MKRVFVFCMLVFLFPWLPVAGDHPQEIPRDMQQKIRSIMTLSCDFEQEREVSVLTEKATSKGKIFYQKSDKLHWQYLTPARSGFVVNGDGIMITGADGQPVPDQSSSRIFRQISKIILMGLDGTGLSDSRDFSVTCASGAGCIVVHLSPAGRDLRKFFTGIDLHFTLPDYIVDKVVICEISGDKTTIRMKNTVVNKPIDPLVFEIK